MSLWEFFTSNIREIFDQTVQHIGLTVISLAIAVTVGVLVGVVLTRYPRFSTQVIGTVGVIQTIPSVALLGFLLPLLGIGVTPAIIALFLYALLPIVRNTYTGIEEVDGSIKEAAKGMGMPDLQILFKVELPLAIPVIFAGIRTAAVTTVGVATLSALIASGGLGEFIFRGIALNNVNMMLAGAILVVEIVSSNPRDDYVIKRNEYEVAQIAEYWIVDAKKKRVRVFTNPRNEEGYGFVDFTEDTSIVSSQFKKLVLSVKELLDPPLVEELIKEEQLRSNRPWRPTIKTWEQRAETWKQRAEKLAQRLLEMGINPED
ncbi:MAG: ABC transporter permease subunit [Prochloron sp. SP5CPC1]|nr:ABC transporter permease subunit [Candidatus Paraprochloron terpiosi SP5CPC1]